MSFICQWSKLVLNFNCNLVNMYITTTTFMFCFLLSISSFCLFLLPNYWILNFYNFPNKEKIIIVLTFCVLIQINTIKEPILPILCSVFDKKRKKTPLLLTPSPAKKLYFGLLSTTTVHHTKLYKFSIVRW